MKPCRTLTGDHFWRRNPQTGEVLCVACGQPEEMTMIADDFRKGVPIEEAELGRLKKLLSQAADIIIWMSGSADFGPGGQAHAGWIKNRATLNAIMAACDMPHQPDQIEAPPVDVSKPREQGDFRITPLGTPRKIGNGCVVVLERWDHAGNPSVDMESVYNFEGAYVGSLAEARHTMRAGVMGAGAPAICPMKAKPSATVCTIGFSSTDAKWYGWSHRAIAGFGIGDRIEEGHIAAETLPIGFEAKTLDDAKRMAIAFAEAVG
jgi:hypothetical protein